MKITRLTQKADTPQMRQFVKYCIVGAMNTCVTLAMIFVCKSWLCINPYISNAIGYLCGLINSFLWNKQWVFRSDKGYCREAARFAAGFGICYCVQFAVVWAISHGAFGTREFHLGFFVISGYGIATLVGSVAYTLCNFAYNRLVTFR